MNPVATALVVFLCLSGSALLGMFLRQRLPSHHLSDDARDLMKLAMGLVGTMSALVLGLVIATAKGTFEDQDAAVKASAAKVLVLDHLLSVYGPDAGEPRELLRRSVARSLEALWPADGRPRVQPGSRETMTLGNDVEAGILALVPGNESQRWVRGEALKVGAEITETRFIALGSLQNGVPVPFLVVVVFWLTIIFANFGLFAPRNGTVITILVLCAVSVAGSVFLILEMNQPFDGLMKVSSAPLQHALLRLGP